MARTLALASRRTRRTRTAGSNPATASARRWAPSATARSRAASFDHTGSHPTRRPAAPRVPGLRATPPTCGTDKRREDGSTTATARVNWPRRIAWTCIVLTVSADDLRGSCGAGGEIGRSWRCGTSAEPALDRFGYGHKSGRLSLLTMRFFPTPCGHLGGAFHKLSHVG